MGEWIAKQVDEYLHENGFKLLAGPLDTEGRMTASKRCFVAKLYAGNSVVGEGEGETLSDAFGEARASVGKVAVIKRAAPQ